MSPAQRLLAVVAVLAAGWMIAACFPFDFDALRDAACDAGPDAPADCHAAGASDGGGDAGGGTADAGERSDGGDDAGSDSEDAGDDAGMDAGQDAGQDAGVDGGEDAGVDGGSMTGCPSGSGDAGAVLEALFLAEPNDQHPAGAARIGTCTFVGGVRESESGVAATGRILTFNAASDQHAVVSVSGPGYYFARDLTAAGATPILAGSYSQDTDVYVKVTQGTTAATWGGTSTPWSAAISAQGTAWADARAIDSNPNGTPGAYVLAGSYGGAPTLGTSTLDEDAGVRGFAAWLPVNGTAPSRVVTIGCPDDPTLDVRVDRVVATPKGGLVVSGIYRASDGCIYPLGNGNNATLAATSGDYFTFAGHFEPTEQIQWLIPLGPAITSAPAVAAIAPDDTVWVVYTSTSGAPSLMHLAENGAALGSIDTSSADTIVRDLKVLTPSGDLLLAGAANGTTVQFGAVPVPIAQPPDAFLARLHPDGGEVGTWAYGGTGLQQIDRIVPTASAGVFLYGEATGPSDFAPVDSAGSSDPDVFVLRVAP